MGHADYHFDYEQQRQHTDPVPVEGTESPLRQTLVDFFRWLRDHTDTWDPMMVSDMGAPDDEQVEELVDVYVGTLLDEPEPVRSEPTPRWDR